MRSRVARSSIGIIVQLQLCVQYVVLVLRYWLREIEWYTVLIMM